MLYLTILLLVTYCLRIGLISHVVCPTHRSGKLDFVYQRTSFPDFFMFDIFAQKKGLYKSPLIIMPF
jgi:hypothetical protein